MPEKIQENIEPAPENTFRCPGCGAASIFNDNFCPFCGLKNNHTTGLDQAMNMVKNEDELMEMTGVSIANESAPEKCTNKFHKDMKAAAEVIYETRGIWGSGDSNKKTKKIKYCSDCGQEL